MKTIGIIGQGFVGTAINEGLAKHYKIETYDIAKNSTCNSIKELNEKSTIIFVCLPTPMEKDGSCHLGIIEPVLEELNKLQIIDGIGYSTKTIVIKSTIPPGTTKQWNEKFNCIDIVFNPEFLTEANSIEDFKNQNRIIVGGPRPATTNVARIYKKVFPKVPIIKTGSTYAEMVKYVTNSFLAMKVSYANEIYQICEAMDIDYDKVIEYAVHDDRLGYSHWMVPGPDGDYGYGGHCFPKDIKALISIAQDLNIPPVMLIATDFKNNNVRTDRDWEKQKGRAVINLNNKLQAI